MKKVSTLIFILLLAIPFFPMGNSIITELHGGSLTENFKIVKAGETFTSGKVLTNKKNGVVICWKNIFEEGRILAGATLNGSSQDMIMTAKQLSPVHICMEIHTGKATYEMRQRIEGYPIYETLPAEIEISATPANSTEVEFVADEEGKLKVWLLEQERFGDNLFKNFNRLLERGSEYKPVSKHFGKILFYLWMAGIFGIGFILLREKELEP